MKEIELNGVKIIDMFLGISSSLEEGDNNRWEINALPQNQLSALGTTMYVTVEFSDKINVGNGVILEFQYDNFSYKEQVGVDKTPTRTKETFSIKAPYASPKIKKVGDHKLTVRVANKTMQGKDLSVNDFDAFAEVPYKII